MTGAVPRVLVNYPASVLESPRAGIPDHRFYGVHHFRSRGYEPVGPSRPAPGWMSLGAAGVVGLGTTGASARAPRRELRTLARSADIVFSPTDVLGLSEIHALRATRLLRRPVVTLMHSPPFTRGGRRHRVAWAPLLRGSDALPCLSETTAAALASRRGCRDKVSVTVLGPDASFPTPPAVYPGEGVVAVGRTMRDFAALTRACETASVRCTIVCPAAAAAALPPCGDLVEVVVPPRDTLPYADVLALLAAARVVAIPLVRPGLLSGHWSLLDALMVGKPVIMTRQPGCGIDIEAREIGAWVEQGDVDGWADALRRIAGDPAAAETMGRRARRLVDGGLDSRRFADGVMDVFDRLLGIDTRPGGPGTPGV